jgi:hypothetical protein
MIRGDVRSMRGLGPTMTAQGQSIGISIGMLPQTLIMSRLDQLSQLGTFSFFIIHNFFFLFVDNLRPEARGPFKSGSWGDRPTCHPQTPPVVMMLTFQSKLLSPSSEFNHNESLKSFKLLCLNRYALTIIP